MLKMNAREESKKLHQAYLEKERKRQERSSMNEFRQKEVGAQVEEKMATFYDKMQRCKVRARNCS